MTAGYGRLGFPGFFSFDDLSSLSPLSSPSRFASLARSPLDRPPSSGKITRPLGGRFLIALAQSVGAGCCAGGTLSIQMRHIPGGGRWLSGMSSLADSLLVIGKRERTGGGEDCASIATGIVARAATAVSARSRRFTTAPVRTRSIRRDALHTWCPSAPRGLDRRNRLPLNALGWRSALPGCWRVPFARRSARTRGHSASPTPRASQWTAALEISRRRRFQPRAPCARHRA